MADVDPSDAASVSTFAVTAAVGAIIILIALMCSVVRGNKDKSENGWFLFVFSLIAQSY